MLEMCMIELEEVVDWFVTVKLSYFITGSPQPLYF